MDRFNFTNFTIGAYRREKANLGQIVEINFLNCQLLKIKFYILSNSTP
jgi:hypothetical protein